MRPLGVCCLLLILFVSGWWPGAFCKGNPRYEKFLTQHYSPKRNFKCDTIMSKRGLTKPNCKEVNTFIHDTKKKIRAVCTNKGGEPYKGQRRSKNKFSVTTCKLRGGSVRPPCKYSENTSSRYIVINCVGGWPVHFDESLI